MIKTLVALATLLCSSSAFAFLGDMLFLHPHAAYREMKTQHFKIVFPKALEPEADQTAVYLEDAHAILSKAFQYEPGHRVTIILTDNEDFANGVTSAVGLQGIVLFMTGPDPYSTIGEYDQWLRSLVIHEYTHYLTLEQTNGIFKFGRYVFGNLLFPNHLWPTWLAEGLAVYAETNFTKAGRGHSAYYNTITRDGISRGTLGSSDFLGFDRLNGTVPDFPFGEAQYYAGYGIIDEMVRKHGKDSPARFSNESSWRIPFFLNGALENISRDHSAENFRTLWDGWIQGEARRMKPELDWLKKHGAKDPEFLTPPGVSATASRISPDGKTVAFVLQSGHERPSLQLVSAQTKEIQKLDDALASGNLAWSPDGSKIFYTKADYDGPYALWSDLFVYDVKNGGSKRLTKSQRAKDPDYCAIGGGAKPSLVFVRQVGRVSELRALELGSEKIRVLYRAPENHRVANPRCDRKGKFVYFSKHSAEPQEQILKLSLAEASAAPVAILGGTQTGFGARFPEPSDDGLYFTRLSQGFFDLAKWDSATGKVFLVARSSGGYWTPSAVSVAGKIKLAASYLSSTGIRASLVNLEHPVLDAPMETVEPVNREPLPPTLGKVAVQRSQYNLLTSLQPRIWSPLIVLDSNRNQFGGTVLGWDDTDQLEYTFYAWYDTVPKSVEGFFATFHRIAGFRLGLAASSDLTDYAFFSDDRRAYNEERKFTVSLSRPFPGVFSSIVPGVLAEWARTYRGGDFGKRTFAPDQRIGASLSFSNRQKFAYSILPERGTAARLEGRRFFSGNLQASKAWLNVEQLLPLYPRHSSLSVNLTGVIAPKPQYDIPESIVKVGGRGTASDLDPPLRGYPLGNFSTRRALLGQAEYRLPIAQIFRGFGTWPIFLQNLGAFGFYDAAKLQRDSGDYSRLISGAGGGLLFNTQLGYGLLPIHLRLEYAHGFRQELAGQDSVSFSIAM